MAAEAAQVVVPPAVQLQPLRLPDDAGALVAFITGQDWTFHYHLRPTDVQVQAWIAAGTYAPPVAQAFWIMVDGERAGFTRLFGLEDIDDGEPQFDLRVGAPWRGRGVARTALRALCDYAFGTWPLLARISVPRPAPTTSRCAACWSPADLFSKDSCVAPGTRLTARATTRCGAACSATTGPLA